MKKKKKYILLCLFFLLVAVSYACFRYMVILPGRNQGSGESELAGAFQKAGILHPDDMSAIIMETYKRAEQGKPFKLEKQIEHAQKNGEKVLNKEMPGGVPL